jgi:hypothetical protein
MVEIRGVSLQLKHCMSKRCATEPNLDNQPELMRMILNVIDKKFKKRGFG